MGKKRGKIVHEPSGAIWNVKQRQKLLFSDPITKIYNYKNTTNIIIQHFLILRRWHT